MIKAYIRDSDNRNTKTLINPLHVAYITENCIVLISGRTLFLSDSEKGKTLNYWNEYITDKIKNLNYNHV